MEVQAGEGSDCDNEIIHKRPDDEKTATVRLFFWCGLSVLRLNESNFLPGTGLEYLNDRVARSGGTKDLGFPVSSVFGPRLF